MPGVTHLVGRFVGSLRPGPPSAVDEAWARSHLSPAEAALWDRMSNPDRRHGVAVARAVAAASPATEEWTITAALLHDVGKIVSGYRTPARVVATVVWAVVDDAVVPQWLTRPRPWRRLAQYHHHPELGAALLTEAHSMDLVRWWAADHHRPPDQWRVPTDAGRILHDCDND